MKKIIFIVLIISSVFYGCSKTITGPAPQPLSVSPQAGYNQSVIPVTITGSGFQAVPFNILSGNLTTKLPQVYLNTSPITYLSVTKVSQTVIQATIPSGIAIAAGTWVTYSVTVVNPTGKSGTLPDAYIVSTYPPPQVTNVFPCGGYNGTTTQITISGSNFFGTPSVIIINGQTGSQTTIPVNSVSPTTIIATVPSGLTPGTYDVVVINPDSQHASLPGGFRVSNIPNPVISSVTPNQASYGQTSGITITITGTGFIQSGTTNVFLSTITSTVYLSNVTVISTTQMTAVIPQTLAVGSYNLTVQNPNCEIGTLNNAFTVVSLPPPSISTVNPMFGWTGGQTNVSIAGANFNFPPRVVLTLSGTTTGMTLTYVAMVSSSQLNAVIPQGMAVGWYNVTVINPDGGTATYPNAFYVSANPPPVITSISPASGATNVATSITITGYDFASNATATAIDSSGNSYNCSIVPPQSSTDITCTVNLPSTGAYVIRVTNTSDNTYYDYASFAVTNPARNVGNTSPSAQSLIIGRQGLAAVTGHDNLGDRFMYALGGDDGFGGHTLDSVEFAQPDEFGNLSPFNLTSPLLYKTTGAAAFQYDNYIYVMGGDAPTATSAIERAKILTTDGAPLLSFEKLSVFTTGTLPANTWVYTVSANLPTNTTDIGESLPSPIVFTSTTSNGAIGFSWNPVQVWDPVTHAFVSATGYNVYRNVSGGFNPVLIAWNIPSTSFVDDGSYNPISITNTTSGFPTALQDPVITSATPSSSGGTLSQGTYFYRISAVNYRGETPALNSMEVTTTSSTSSVTISFAPVPGAEYYKVYRTPYADMPQDNEVLLLPMTLSTTIVDDGGTTPDQSIVPSSGSIAPLPYGSLGPFMQLSASLSSARAYLGAAVGHTQTGTTYGYAIGGTGNGSAALGTVDTMALSANPITSVTLTSGSLAGGTYTYAVTAITPDGELPNAGMLVTSVSTGGVQFTWDAVPSASAYNIYRDTGSGLQYIHTIVGTTFTDNGSFSPTPGASPAGGGLGNPSPTSALQTARFQLATLSADKTNLPTAITDTSSYLYIGGGYNGGTVNTIEVSRIQGDGSLEPFQYLKQSNGISNALYAICGQIQLIDSNDFFYVFAGYPLTQNIEDFEFGSSPYTLYTGYPNNDGGKTLTYHYLGSGVLLGSYFYLIGGASAGSPTALSSDTVLNTVEQVIY